MCLGHGKAFSLENILLENMAVQPVDVTGFRKLEKKRLHEVSW